MVGVLLAWRVPLKTDVGERIYPESLSSVYGLDAGCWAINLGELLASTRKLSLQHHCPH